MRKAFILLITVGAIGCGGSSNNTTNVANMRGTNTNTGYVQNTNTNVPPPMPSNPVNISPPSVSSSPTKGGPTPHTSPTKK